MLGVRYAISAPYLTPSIQNLTPFYLKTDLEFNSNKVKLKSLVTYCLFVNVFNFVLEAQFTDKSYP